MASTFYVERRIQACIPSLRPLSSSPSTKSGPPRRRRGLLGLGSTEASQEPMTGSRAFRRQDSPAINSPARSVPRRSRRAVRHQNSIVPDQGAFRMLSRTASSMIASAARSQSLDPQRSLTPIEITTRQSIRMTPSQWEDLLERMRESNRASSSRPNSSCSSTSKPPKRLD